MTELIRSEFNYFNREQKKAFDSLISEKKWLVDLISYQWWVEEVEALSYMDKDSLWDRIDHYKEIIKRVDFLTSLITSIVVGQSDPIEQLSLYEARYSLDNFTNN